MTHVKRANLHDTEIQKGTIYNNGELAFLDKVSDINLAESIQMEIYVVVLYSHILLGLAQAFVYCLYCFLKEI